MPAPPTPHTLQIPTANDIPIDFRITLLRNAPCERTPQVHSSKAVGEPPFFLGERGPPGWWGLHAQQWGLLAAARAINEPRAPHAPGGAQHALPSLPPPALAGTSVFFALKEACYAARKDAGLGDAWFPLDLPATPERLRMACADDLTAPYAPPGLMPKISC